MQDEKAVRLFEKILEKTRSKALKWEATAEEGQYVATIGPDLVVKVWPFTIIVDGDPQGPPSVSLNDEQGTIILDMTYKIDGITRDELDEIAALAKRAALNIDSKIESALKRLEALDDDDIPF